VLLVRKRGTTAFMQPGGKRDSGEDDITALAREIDEELGCRLVSDSIRSLGAFDAVSANEPGFQVRAALYEIDVTGRDRAESRDRGDGVDRPGGACRYPAGAVDPRPCVAAGVAETCRGRRLNRMSAMLH
jgi:8-oxo-dGTP pyrophosphatase MutT (NUDIX family)